MPTLIFSEFNMRKAEIKCIAKAENNANKITFIGGTTSNSTRWKQSLEKTIKEIENNEWEYVVLKDGQYCKIVVAIDENGCKYIRPEDEDLESNFLTTLPSCP